ncbi:MAG TPA: cyclic nucleotide-binding protein [Planctomycetes bacterium]|nr:cyclic nucleotide-binding protein [Planctomycetota bacterium]
MGADSPSSRQAGGRAGDMWGALAATLVALPSSIAFGIMIFTAISPESAGMGAVAGALGAAALGLVEPLAGRNGGFITAPCAPAAAVMSGLAGSLSVQQGLPPAEVMALMTLTALLCAGLQVAAGLIKLGRLIKYVPYQVVSGYLTGVGVIIAIGQLPKLLGTPQGAALSEGLLNPSSWSGPALAVGAVTIAATLLAPRVTRQVPGPIVGLALGLVAYFAIGLLLRRELLTTADNPLVIGSLGAQGDLLGVIAERVRSLSALRLADVALVFPAAATLAALLSIDTLKTGVVLDTLTRSRHDSNRELIAQGASNALAALVGGAPGAGTMGPTLVNVTSGGNSPLSGFLCGALCLLSFLLLSPLLAWIPISALAGILLVVAFRMVDWNAFRLLKHRETRLDFAVIAAVVITAEGVGLIQASVVGVALAILLFIRAQMRSSVILRLRTLSQVSSKRRRPHWERVILDRLGERALLVELQGDLFFGTTDQLQSELAPYLETCRYVLLDLRRIQSVDYTGGHLFGVLHEQLADSGGGLLLAGMPSSLPTRQDVERYLKDVGLLSGERGIAIHETRHDALVWLEEHVLRESGVEAGVDEALLGLGDMELVSGLGEDSLQRLSEVAREVHLDAGQRVFASGDASDELYLIRRGEVDILLQLPGDKRHHLMTFGPGSHFGELAFLDRQARSADAEAGHGGCDLYVLSRERFDAVAEADPVISSAVFAQLALAGSRRLRSADAELATLEER